MAPEQARNEPVDERADVFALGGILCAILTGKPPIEGDTVLAAVMNAAAGALESAFARLDACAADAELVALAKRCLAPARDDRFAHAGAVAVAVAAYRAGIEARVRRAEADRAAAEARAEEEANTRREADARAAAEADARRAAEERLHEQRKRRLTQLLLACAVALLGFVVAGFVWYLDHQRSAEKQQQAELQAEQARREKAEAEEKAGRERDATTARAALKLATDLRVRRRFADAGGALAQAEKLAAGAKAADLQAAVRREKSDTALARDLDAIRGDKFRWVTAPDGASGNFAFAEDRKGFGERYAAALAAGGFDVRTGPADAVAKKVLASAVRGEIVRALDDWALTVLDADPPAAERAIEVARRASPNDDMANRFRDFAVMRERDPKARLPLPPDAVDLAASAPAVLLAAALIERRKGEPGVPLAVGLAAHPNDFDIALAAALWFHDRDPARAIGFNRVALALNPDHAAALTNLGLLLTNSGELGTAVALLERAVKLYPNDHIAHFNLGGAVYERGGKSPPAFRRADYDRAETAYRRTLELSPNYGAAHSNLGAMYGNRNAPGDKDRALAALAAAVKLAPNEPTVRSNYGLAIQRTGDLKGALREYEESIRLDPKHAAGYLHIGAVRELEGDIPGARAMLKRAVELDKAAYGAEFEKFQKRYPEPK